MVVEVVHIYYTQQSSYKMVKAFFCDWTLADKFERLRLFYMSERVAAWLYEEVLLACQCH